MRTLQNRSKQGKEKTSDQKVGGSNPSRHAISSSYPMSLSRRELDSTVVNIELTLVSIIQGVALYFLTENARTALSLNNWPALLYISAGLCVIFIFWSRSIIHTLTCAPGINRWLNFFVDRAGNVWLIAAQSLSFRIYPFYVTRFYDRLAPLILHSHEAASES